MSEEQTHFAIVTEEGSGNDYLVIYTSACGIERVNREHTWTVNPDLVDCPVCCAYLERSAK